MCVTLDMVMKSLTNFQTTRFANSVRFVFINLRIDYAALRQSLTNAIVNKENSEDADDRNKAAKGRCIRRTMNSWVFYLSLSGCADMYMTCMDSLQMFVNGSISCLMKDMPKRVH